MKKKRKIALPQNGSELIELLTTEYSIDSGAALVLVQAAGQALDQALEAEGLLKRDGLVSEGERGLKAHPAANIARDSRNRLIACLGKLNLEL